MNQENKIKSLMKALDVVKDNGENDDEYKNYSYRATRQANITFLPKLPNLCTSGFLTSIKILLTKISVRYRALLDHDRNWFYK